MVTPDNIAKLADLSRLEVAADEAARLAGDIEGVLGFVAAAKVAAARAPEEIDYGFAPVDCLRADEGVEVAGENREALLAEAPQTRDGYVEVQKVLGGRGGEA